MRLAVLAVVVIAAAGAGACKSEPPEYDGIGAWKVTRTRLADATGRCDPTDLPDGRKGSYCFGQTAIKLAGSPTEIDLYFDGTDPTSKLIEEQLKVHGCHEEATLSFLRRLFGTPSEFHGAKVFWKNRFVFIAAIVPSEAGQCLIRVFPLSETSEIEKVRTAE